MSGIVNGSQPFSRLASIAGALEKQTVKVSFLHYIPRSVSSMGPLLALFVASTGSVVLDEWIIIIVGHIH